MSAPRDERPADDALEDDEDTLPGASTARRDFRAAAPTLVDPTFQEEDVPTLIHQLESFEETRPQASVPPTAARSFAEASVGTAAEEFVEPTTPSLTMPGAASTGVNTPSASKPSAVRRLNAVLGLLVLALASGVGTYHWLPLAAPSRAASDITQNDKHCGDGTPNPKAPSKRKAPVVDVPIAKNPSERVAAAAFARGDFTQALSHYRGLAERRPDATYELMVRILTQRLTPKPIRGSD